MEPKFTRRGGPHPDTDGALGGQRDGLAGFPVSDGRGPPMPCTLAVFPREPADTGASAQGSPAYRPRKPEASPLWQL
jgi:hypothetical protein